MSRGKESIQETEEARAMLGVKDVFVEEGVEFGIKRWVV